MEKKKIIILNVIAITTFMLLLIVATYAYFTAQIDDGKRTEINVTAYTTDVLTFATGDAVSLEADQTTLGKDKGSVSGATYASALLTANNKTNNAVEHYYLYLNIENNTFTYSVQDNKPELIMTITDKDGNEVKDIAGLTYTEVTDRTNKKISGYDITTKNGIVTIFNNREITAEPKAEDKWNITITFVNYEADQNANAGKVLSTKLIIQKNEMFDSLSDVCSGGETLTSCITSLSQKSASGASKIYHHDGSLKNGAGDNSYRYAGRDEVPHPAYYSCKYKGEDVSNVAGELNRLLKGDCDSVSMIYSGEVLYIDKSITKQILDKTTVKWDNVNNKCVTTSEEDVLNFSTEEALPQSLCNGYAYKIATSEGESPWVGGVKIEELGPGEETLFTPEDKENQKPALYSCKYNGIDVLNLKNGDTNSSLKGDCSSVFKISVKEDVKFIDKSIDKATANKQSVKWDKENNKCVTSTGEDVSSVGGNIINYEEDCVGDAYFIGDKWLGIIGIEKFGAGEETLVEPENKGLNNYVCFGSNESPCPTDNLYRIIGVFDHKINKTQSEQRVKLIKYDYATSNLLGTDGDYSTDTFAKSDIPTYSGELTTINRYYWNYKNDTSINNGNGSNEWSTSLLNKTNLNTNYLNKIGTTWSNLIDDTTWKVSGDIRDELTPKAIYTAEITNATKTYGPENGTSKIGLMYASDYGFAAAPSAWTSNIIASDSDDSDGSAISEVNWMYMGGVEWTITPNSSNSYNLFILLLFYNLYSISADTGLGVRPVLYLKASVAYAGGTGTQSDPITIN